MICKECQKQELKSCVFPNGMSMVTAMYCQPYYDENGKYHIHDRNTTTTGYRCSNDHEWSVKMSGSCWCGWPSEKKSDPT